MIKVSRPISGAPTVWLTKAATERQEVIAAFQAARKESVARQKKLKKKAPEFSFSFEFKVYGDELLRDAINRVYGYKCAYCESDFGATQPVAVEHYRPKGEVLEGGDRVKPAYYWLAADWENLLPSCTDCNSPRKQVDSPDGKKRVRGKGNHFPLEPGSKRARSPGKETEERPLLLHPELGEPGEHLEFLAEEDRAGLIRAALVSGQPSEKGVQSIEVYALDRPGLQQARQKVAAKLLSHLRNTRASEGRYRANPTDAALKAEYDENVADLKRCYLDSGNGYSAMARQIVKARLPGVAL